MKKNNSTCIFILITLIVITSNAFARMERGPGDKPSHRRDMRIDENEIKGIFYGDPEAIKAGMGISDDQMERIKKINYNYKQKLIKIREIIQPKQVKLEKMLLMNNVNLKDVRSLLEEISRLEVEIRMLMIYQQLDIKKILSTAQTK